METDELALGNCSRKLVVSSLINVLRNVPTFLCRFRCSFYLFLPNSPKAHICDELLVCWLQ